MSLTLTTLNEPSVQALDDFFGLIELSPFKSELRNLLLYYLTHEANELPDNYGTFIEDMKFFFDCLDRVELA